MLEKHEVELWSEMLGWNKSWREKSWYERFEAALRIFLGFGDDVISVVASAIMPKKVKWLWPNRVPLGKLTLFVGDPDNGKSMVATYVAARVTSGRAWFDGKNLVPSEEVLIFASEDDVDDTAVPRLKAAGADLDKVRFAQMRAGDVKEAQVERQMRLDKDIPTIEKFLLDNRQIRAVVIDPVSNYLGDTKMTDEQTVRRVLSPLQELAKKTSVAIIGIMHLNKKADLKVIDRVGGAMAFVGVARAVWLFARDGEHPDVFHMVGVKKNIGARIGGLKYRIATKAVKIEGEDVQEPYVDWLGWSEGSGDDILAAKPVGRPPVEHKYAVDYLKASLVGGPQPATQVIAQGEADGFSESTLKRAKSDAGVESVKRGDGWDWKLKPIEAKVSGDKAQGGQNP